MTRNVVLLASLLAVLLFGKSRREIDRVTQVFRRRIGDEFNRYVKDTADGLQLKPEGLELVEKGLEFYLSLGPDNPERKKLVELLSKIVQQFGTARVDLRSEKHRHVLELVLQLLKT